MSQPMYSPPPPPGPPVSASASNQAITALVLGILGIIPCCTIVAPIAWYLGQAELGAIRQGRSPAAGEGMAMAGKIMGIIGTILLIFALLWVVFLGGMTVLRGLANR